MLSHSRLAGRTALVTGASRGVGAAIASRLGAEGARVAVNYRADAAAAHEVVDTIRQSGGTAEAFAGAIGVEESMAQLVADVRDRFGPVDLVVSNAGVASRGRTLVDSAAAEYEELLAVHALGPIALLKHLLPDLRSAARSDVVVISSVTTDHAPPQAAPYTMAKSAMETAARTLAREERRHGVRVNIVAPGLVETDMGTRLVRALKGGAQLAALHADYPFGRVCQPSDVAGVVAFLVGPDGAYLTGQRIVVDGGGADPSLI